MTLGCALLCAILTLPAGAALADTPIKAPPGVDCLITAFRVYLDDPRLGWGADFKGVSPEGADCVGTAGLGYSASPPAVPEELRGTTTDNVKALVLAMSALDWGANVGPAAKFSDELEAKLKAAGVNLGWVYQKLYQNSGEPEPAWVPKTPQKPYMNQTSESGTTSGKTSEKKTTTVQDSSGKTATATQSGGKTTVTTTDESGHSRTTTLDDETAKRLEERLKALDARMTESAVTGVTLPGGATVDVPGGGLSSEFQQAVDSESAAVWGAATQAQKRFQARLMMIAGSVAVGCFLVALLLVLGRLGVLAAWKRELAWRLDGWRYARRQRW